VNKLTLTLGAAIALASLAGTAKCDGQEQPGMCRRACYTNNPTRDTTAFPISPAADISGLPGTPSKHPGRTAPSYYSPEPSLHPTKIPAPTRPTPSYYPPASPTATKIPGRTAPSYYSPAPMPTPSKHHS
jgi:hypothetical protein